MEGRVGSSALVEEDVHARNVTIEFLCAILRNSDLELRVDGLVLECGSLETELRFPGRYWIAALNRDGNASCKRQGKFPAALKESLLALKASDWAFEKRSQFGSGRLVVLGLREQPPFRLLWVEGEFEIGRARLVDDHPNLLAFRLGKPELVLGRTDDRCRPWLPNTVWDVGFGLLLEPV